MIQEQQALVASQKKAIKELEDRISEQSLRMTQIEAENNRFKDEMKHAIEVNANELAGTQRAATARSQKCLEDQAEAHKKDRAAQVVS